MTNICEWCLQPPRQPSELVLMLREAAQRNPAHSLYEVAAKRIEELESRDSDGTAISGGMRRHTGPSGLPSAGLG